MRDTLNLAQLLKLSSDDMFLSPTLKLEEAVVFSNVFWCKNSRENLLKRGMLRFKSSIVLHFFQGEKRPKSKIELALCLHP